MRMSLKIFASFALLNEVKNSCWRGNFLAMALRKGWQADQLALPLFICTNSHLKAPFWNEVSFVVDDYMFTY